MKNKVKRTLSFLLTFVMLCSLLPTMALAKEPEGRYETVAVIGSLVKDATVEVFATKGAGTIKLTGINAVETTFTEGIGYREYTATANEGWVFDTWKYEQWFKPVIGDKKDLGNRTDRNGTRYSFTNTGDNWRDPYTEGNQTISVNRLSTTGETIWNPISYKIYADFNPTITATAGNNGTISGSEKPVEVTYGEDQAFKIEAAAGYVIDTITVDGKAIAEGKNEASYTYTFENVIAPHTIDVTFKVKPEPGKCTVTYVVEGDIPADYQAPNEVIVDENTEYTVAEVPEEIITDEGTYTFDGWYNGKDKVEGTIVVTSDVALTGFWTFAGEKDVWNTVYGSIRVYMDEGTKADFNNLPGLNVNKQVRIYSEKYPSPNYRLTVPVADYWGTTNIAERVTARDISKIVLVKDQLIGSSEKIIIPLEGNDDYAVTVSEGTDKFGLIPYSYLKIEITNIPVVNKTVDVTFTVDSSKGSFTEYEEGPVEFKGIAADSTEQFAVPEVTAKEGYVFTGWKILGDPAGYLPKEMTSFELANINKQIEFDENGKGQVTIEAVFEEVPAVNKTVDVTFTVDSGKGSFTEYEEGPVEFKGIAADSKEQFAVPEVTAKEGYAFTGWKILGNDVGYLPKEMTSFELANIDKQIQFDENGKGQVTIEAVFEEVPVTTEGKTVEVTFTVNPAYGSFTEYGEGPVTFKNIEADSTQQFEVPKVTAKAGYKFVGWKGQGADVIEWDANASTFGVPGLCYFAEGSNVGYASIEAVFEEVPVTTEGKTVEVTFTVNPAYGSFTEYGEGPVTFKNIEADSTQQFEVPKVTAKAGYKFVGWKGQGADVIEWDANASTFGVPGLCYFAEGSNVGYASIEAVFEEVPVTTEGKTVEVTFTVNPAYGSFTEYGEGPVTFKNIEADSTQQFEVPKVTAKAGYKFVGWKGQGADVIEWDANASTFGVPGLCYFAEGSNVGYASIEAVFEEVPVTTEGKTVEVTFTVNPAYGSFTEYGEGPVTFKNIEADSTQQFEVPKVTAKAGYKFVGWKGQGADVIKWDANASTFGVPGLCYFAEGSNVGYASIEAVFEKEGGSGSHTNDYYVTIIVDGKGKVKAEDYGTVGSDETDVITIPDFENNVKFTMEPADGWRIHDVLVNGKSVGDVESYVLKDDVLMEGPVLKVIFEKRSSGGSSSSNNHKDDDKDKEKAPDKTPDALNGEDHFDYIVGDADGLVHPERNISRAEVASIFFRLLKDDVRNDNLTDQNTFTDVSTNAWYNVAVSTMSDMGIVFGRTEYQFAPEEYITRAEFAAIAARFDSESYNGENLFTDIEGHWAANQINRAAEKGWITGYPDGTFDPNRYITRAEAVTMINRVLNRMPKDVDALDADMKVFADNKDTNAWYYLAIQEATNSHEYEKDKDGVYETWTEVLPDRDWAQYLNLN